MTVNQQAARLRARLYRTPDGHAATRRDLALEYTRLCPRSASAWASLSSALIDLGLFTKARVALTRLERLGRDEHPYLVRVHLGGYFNAMGDLKRAERWYRKAAEAAPAALVFLGAVLARQGRLAEAKRYHRQATHAPEDDCLARDEAYFNLGLICRAERRYREALAHFERAIALDPKYTAALEAKADVETALKVEVPEEHATHWRQMLDAMGPSPATAHELVRAYTKRYPRRFGGWLVFADVLAGFARYDEAAKALRKGERLGKSENWRESPDDRFAVQWGLLNEQKKDFKRAERMFRRAVLLRPSARNLTQLAEVLVVQGQHTEARRHLQRAIRLGPDDPSTAYYQLALIARARGQYADALEGLDAAIRHSPKYPLALVARRDVREAIKVSGSR
jgi:tetratricopeptide (TPR) repeat protein